MFLGIKGEEKEGEVLEEFFFVFFFFAEGVRDMFLFVDIVLPVQEIDGGYSHIFNIYTHTHEPRSK